MYDILGWVAAALGMSAAVPQLVRLWRTRISAGLSVLMWQLTAGTTAAWAMHAFWVGAVQMQVPNIVCSALGVAVLWFIARDRGRSFLLSLVVPAVGAVALFGLDLWLGAVVFGTVMAVPSAYAQLSQFMFMRRSADLSGVSFPTLLFLLCCQLLWVVWAFGVREQAMMVTASVMLVLCGLNVGYWLWRRARGTAGPTTVEQLGGDVARVA